MKPLVLDSGALIALARRNYRALALLDAIIAGRAVTHVPAGALVVTSDPKGLRRLDPNIELVTV